MKINNSHVLTGNIFVPDKSEQQKIVEFLSIVDQKIQLLFQRKEQLEKYKRGVVQLIFSQKLRFRDANGKVFSERKQGKLGELAKIVKGQQLNKSTLSQTGNYAVFNGGVSPSGYTENWNIEGGTITISEGGNSCGYVNFSKNKFWCGGHCYALKEVIVNKTFLFQILKFYQDLIMQLRVGSGLPNIQKKHIEGFKLKYPQDEREQQKISDFLCALDKKTDKVAEQIEKMKIWKKGLLQKMFI